MCKWEGKAIYDFIQVVPNAEFSNFMRNSNNNNKRIITMGFKIGAFKGITI